MTEHDGADAQDAREVAGRPDEGQHDRPSAADDVPAPAALPALPGRTERAWAKGLWLSMSRREADTLPRSARA